MMRSPHFVSTLFKTRISRSFKVSIRPELYLAVAIALLIFPVRWVLSWLLACSVHELSHWIALRRCNVAINRMVIGVGGAVIETGPISVKEELLCALAGPAGSFLLLSLLYIFPAFSVCGAMQGAFNLLPLFPLDGGRVMHCALSLLKNRKAATAIACTVYAAVFAAVLAISLLALLQGFGFWPLLFALILLFRTAKENPLAKLAN